MNLQVTHFERKPTPSTFSIERLFGYIRAAMDPSIQITVHHNPFPSQGVVPRVRGVLDAMHHQGAVNHVTGDVHFLALGLRRSRSVLTIHDCGNLHRLKGIRRQVLKWFWFTAPMRRVAVVTTISEATKADIVRITGFPGSRITVIPNCIAPEFRFSPKPWPAQFPRALMVGTTPTKNHVRMAAALEGLGVDVDCIGVLSDAQRTAFQHRGIAYRELGRLTDQEVLEAYQRCDFLMFASLLEGFGMPILEAQAIGRPVVTSNCSSMPEVAGDAAVFVNPTDVGSIRRGVKRLLGDPGLRERLISDGSRRIGSFAPESIAARYAAVYRKVAGV